MQSQKKEKNIKEFPKFFAQLGLPPEGAKEESIEVYRACRSGQCDKNSFLPTFIEKNIDSPEYEECSLSVYEKPKDIKRFCDMNSDMGIPYKIAIGKTNPVYGKVQRTKARMKKYRSSHIDWWLYEDATPHKEFKLIEDFKQYLNRYSEEKRKNNER